MQLLLGQLSTHIAAQITSYFVRSIGASTMPNLARSASAAPYILGTTVPDYWIPLVPEMGDTSSMNTAMHLRRGALPRFEHGVGRSPQALGQILEPQRPLLLQNEEVPREGARVTRTYQYTRWIDGGTHLWIGRRKAPGRGEGSSGLRFDVVEQGKDTTDVDTGTPIGNVVFDISTFDGDAGLG